MKLFRFVILVVTVFYSQTVWAEHSGFEGVQKKVLFDDLVRHIERIDAEILEVRKNRPESWEVTTQKMRNEFINAKDDKEAYHTLQKLDATYPGLHTSISVPNEFDFASELLKNFRLPFTVYPVFKDKGAELRVAQVLPVAQNKIFSEDQIKAIDGVELNGLLQDAFLFCNYATSEFCYEDILLGLHQGFLRAQLKNKKSVEIQVLRNGFVRAVTVPIVTASEVGNLYAKPVESCADELGRYQETVALYLGNQLCLYQSQNPKVGILRVKSFETRNGVRFHEEVTKMKAVWKGVYQRWDALIVDVIDNQGGDVPIPLTALLMTQDFQDQWMQLKNVPEVYDPLFLSELYNGDFVGRSMKATRRFTDKFLPPFPQFPNEKNPGKLYEPDAFAFSKKLIVMQNKDCISSCSGFLWSLKRYAGDRVVSVGQADSADTTYARLNLVAFRDVFSPNGYVIKMNVNPSWMSEQVLFKMKLSISKSTDELGVNYSMKVEPVDFYVSPMKSHSQWVNQVYGKALNLTH